MPMTHNRFSSPVQAEEAFYSAFHRCDTESMAAVWARDNVICVHPGSYAIVGYDAVMRSWTNIFTNSELPEIQVNLLSSIVDDNLAVHMVEEYLRTGDDNHASVLATNIYRKFADSWRMVSHHGSVVNAPAESHTLQ